MMKKPPYSGCPQELYNLYSVDHFFFCYHFLRHSHYYGKVMG